MTNNQHYKYDNNLPYDEAQDRADNEEIVTAIITKREELGLSQEWVAGQAGFSITQYIRIEQQERRITYEDMIRIGMALAEYEESLKPPYQRELIQTKRKISRYIYHYFDSLFVGLVRVFAHLAIALIHALIFVLQVWGNIKRGLR